MAPADDDLADDAAPQQDDALAGDARHEVEPPVGDLSYGDPSVMDVAGDQPSDHIGDER